MEGWREGGRQAGREIEREIEREREKQGGGREVGRYLIGCYRRPPLPHRPPPGPWWRGGTGTGGTAAGYPPHGLGPSHPR